MNKIKIKLRLEKFIKEELWQHIIVLAFVFIFAYIFDKYIEAIIFCISHIIIRLYFDKQYHCGTTALCLFTTLTIAFLGIMYALPLGASLLSIIPMCFFIAWVGNLAQDKVDYYSLCKKLQTEIDDLFIQLQAYKKIDIYQMNEDDLRNFGASRKLSEIQQDILVMRVIEHLTIAQICKYRRYGRTTIKYHISQIKNKLKVDYI